MKYNYLSGIKVTDYGTIFVKTNAKKDKTGYERNYCIIREDGKTKQLTYDGNAGFFRVKDNALYFMAKRSEEEKKDEYNSVIYKLELDGGEAHPALTIDSTISSFDFITDDTLIGTKGVDKRIENLSVEERKKIEKELDIHINLEELFGTTAETQRKNDSVAHASRLKTDESYLDHGHFLTSTRTSIDRFTGSALDQSLFTQNVYIGGDGVLKFYLPKNEELKPHIGLLLLALEDLRKGYCALGGSTSIGYGILNGDKIKVNEETIDINKNEYVDALAKVEE